MFTLTLPYPPSVNSYYGNTRPVRVYIKKKGRDYRKFVVNNFNTSNSLTQRLQVEISLFPPDKRKRDLDNILKCLLDSLTHSGVYKDDSQIDILIVRRKEVVKNGSCIVSFSSMDSFLFDLELPYPPSINSYYGRTGSGRVYIKDKGRDYRNFVVDNFNTSETLDSKLQVEISLFPPDKRKRDLDNTLKCLLDSLTHAHIYEDDSQIDTLIVRRKEVVKNGSCEVSFSVIS